MLPYKHWKTAKVFQKELKNMPKDFNLWFSQALLPLALEERASLYFRFVASTDFNRVSTLPLQSRYGYCQKFPTDEYLSNVSSVQQNLLPLFLAIFKFNPSRRLFSFTPSFNASNFLQIVVALFLTSPQVRFFQLLLSTLLCPLPSLGRYWVLGIFLFAIHP